MNSNELGLTFEGTSLYYRKIERFKEGMRIAQSAFEQRCQEADRQSADTRKVLKDKDDYVSISSPIIQIAD